MCLCEGECLGKRRKNRESKEREIMVLKVKFKYFAAGLEKKETIKKFLNSLNIKK